MYIFEEGTKESKSVLLESYSLVADQPAFSGNIEIGRRVAEMIPKSGYSQIAKLMSPNATNFFEDSAVELV